MLTPVENVALGEGCILLVDDEEMVRRVAQGMLAKLGYAVVSVGSGDEAVAAAADDPDGFDLVVLDMVMPGMNGLETFRALRDIRADIPVLICSGYAHDSDIEALSGAKRLGFIKKPVGLRELASAVALSLRGDDPSGSGIQAVRTTGDGTSRQFRNDET